MHSRTRMSNSTVSFRMKSKKITIAIFGLGTVGGGTLELLQKKPIKFWGRHPFCSH